MRPYKALLLVKVKSLFQYRTAAVAGFFTQTFFGIIRLMILISFFGATRQSIPLSLAQTVNYIWLGQILFTILPFRIDPEIATMIRNGNVAYELVRPLNLFAYWYVKAVALRSIPIVLRAVPMIIMAAFLLPLLGRPDWALQPPPTLAAGIGMGFSLIFAILVSAGITVFASLLLLLFISQDGVVSFLYVLVWGLTGILVPLPFFPDVLKNMFYFLPFRGVMDVPCQIYSGSIHGTSIIYEIGLQAFWVVFLVITGTLLAKALTKRVTAQGG
ncbi:MAG: ABC-2 family transporter protein [Spirochaetales bacterium]|nr:ABC-2 family transporter protein [Spirochaetales bacterium]